MTPALNDPTHHLKVSNDPHFTPPDISDDVPYFNLLNVPPVTDVIEPPDADVFELLDFKSPDSKA